MRCTDMFYLGQGLEANIALLCCICLSVQWSHIVHSAGYIIICEYGYHMHSIQLWM